MATMNVSLPEPLKAWVEEQVVAEIQALITQGVESGAALPFDKAAFLARVKRQHDRA